MKYLLIAVIGFIPFLSSAATFHYVNTAGVTATVEAPDAQTALLIAPDIKANSGVVIDEGLIDSGDPVAVSASDVNAFGYSANADALATFHYVNAEGVTDTVAAPDAQTALTVAPNIAVHSGVAIDQGHIEPGMMVPSVD